MESPLSGAESVRVIRDRCKPDKWQEKGYHEGIQKIAGVAFCLTQRGLWNIAKKRILGDSGVSPREDGDLLRDYQATHEENWFVVCEHTEEVEKEQSPARVNAPPQKRRAVTRVEFAETQDHVSEPQWLEGIDDEEMEELSFIQCSQRAALGLVCDNACNEEGSKPTCGHCGQRRKSSAHDQPVQATL